MKNFFKNNWHLFLHIGILLSPFYLSLLRKSLQVNGFEVDNVALVATAVIASVAIGFIHAARNT